MMARTKELGVNFKTRKVGPKAKFQYVRVMSCKPRISSIESMDIIDSFAII